MADQLQLRGGSEQEHDTFTGAAKEITVNTDDYSLRVHDGTTAGGHVVASADYVSTQIGSIKVGDLSDVDTGTPSDGDRLQLVYNNSNQTWEPLEFEYEVGDPGPAGGIIFFVDKHNDYDFTYLESSTEDQSTGMGWSNNNTTNIPLTSMDLGQGARNTQVVIDGSSTSAALTASGYSGGGFSDWFLPSRDELNLMYTHLHCQGLASFAADHYWSSSQYNSSNAWRQNFANGTQANLAKSDSYRVRAVRAF